jgi:hypothetical protein
VSLPELVWGLCLLLLLLAGICKSLLCLWRIVFVLLLGMGGSMLGLLLLPLLTYLGAAAPEAV